jgi:hypothetical protein
MIPPNSPKVVLERMKLALVEDTQLLGEGE